MDRVSWVSILAQTAMRWRYCAVGEIRDVERAQAFHKRVQAQESPANTSAQMV